MGVTEKAKNKILSTAIFCFLFITMSFTNSFGQSAKDILLKGNTYYNNIEQRDSAILFMEQALSLYADEAKHDTIMEAAFSIGQFLNTERGPKAAISWLTEFKKQHEDKLPPSHGHWLYINYQFANAHNILNNFDSVFHYIDISKKIIAESKAPVSMIIRIYNMDAWSALNRRMYNRGITSAKSSFNWAAKTYADTHYLANAALHTWACLLHYASKQDSALQIAEWHHTLTGNIDGINSTQYAASHNLLGAIFEKMHNYEQAMHHYKEAEAIYQNDFERTGQLYDLSIVLGNIGLLYFQNHEYILAEKYCLKSLEVGKGLYDVYNLNFLYDHGHLAQIYAALDRPHKARHHAEALITILDANPTATLTTKAQYYNLVGFVYRQLNEYQSAIKYLSLSHEYYQSSGEEATNFFVAPLVTLGNVYGLKNDRITARTYYRKALQQYENLNTTKKVGLSDVYTALASSYFEESNEQRANELIDSAIAVLNDYASLDFLSNLKNITWHSKLFEIVNIKLDILSRSSLQNYDQLHSIVTAFDNKLVDYLPFIRSEYRLQEVQELAKKIYNHYIEIALEHNKIAEALYYAERTRALTVKLALQGIEVARTSDLPNDMVDKLLLSKARVREELNNQFVGVSNDSAQAKHVSSSVEAHQQLKLKLQSKYPHFYEQIFSLTDFPTHEVFTSLQDEEVILVFHELDENMVVFIIHHEGLFYHNYQQSLSEELISQGVEKMMTLQDIDLEYKNLYNVILYPIKSYIKNKKLVIVPDGKLHYLSFEALIDQSGKYLIYSNEILYALSVELALNKFDNPSQQAYVFAPGFIFNESKRNPSKSMGSDSIHSLVSQQPHALGLAKALGKQNWTESFVGESATEEQFYKVADNANILVIASHAFIDDDQPLLSKILFAAPDDSTSEQDGMLHTYEIYNQPIHADLTILTACNTGMGQFHSGEGMLSLAHAFSYSGCPNIISTKWSVDELTSIDIIRRFMRADIGSSSFASSLRQAKINFLNISPPELQHPYYWAGLTITGALHQEHQINYWIYFVLMLILFTFFAILLKRLKSILRK